MSPIVIYAEMLVHRTLARSKVLFMQTRLLQRISAFQLAHLNIEYLISFVSGLPPPSPLQRAHMSHREAYVSMIFYFILNVLASQSS